MLNHKFNGPMGLEQWCKLVIAASYPMHQEADAAIAAQEYIDWLNSLPVTKEV